MLCGPRSHGAPPLLFCSSSPACSARSVGFLCRLLPGARLLFLPAAAGELCERLGMATSQAYASTGVQHICLPTRGGKEAAKHAHHVTGSRFR